MIDFKHGNSTHRPRTLDEHHVGILVDGPHFLRPNLRSWVTPSPYEVSRNNVPLHNPVLGLRFCFFAKHFFDHLCRVLHCPA